MDDTPATSFERVNIAPFPQEALLIDAVAEMAAAVPVRRLVCMSAGLAQFAGAAAMAMPRAEVLCTYLDLYRTNRALDYWRDRPPNMWIECAADVYGEDADIVAIPFSASGETELARELIQAGHARLQLG